MLEREAVKLVSDAVARQCRSVGALVVVVHGTGATRARAVVETAMNAVDLPADAEVAALVCAATPDPPMSLARAVSAVATDRLGLDHVDPADATATEVGAYRLLAAPVLALVAAAPTVLTVAEAQWADEKSLSWFAYLLRRATRPVCLVLAVRGEPGTAVTALAGSMLGHGACDALSVALHDHDKPDHDQPDSVRLAPGRAAARHHSRERHLSDSAKRVLRAAAVLGTTDDDLVAALARLPVEEVSRVLRDHDRTAADTAELSAALLAELDAADARWWRQEAARLLNDAGCCAEQVAGHLLQLPGFPEPWMRTALSDAALAAAHRGAPDSAITYLAALQESQLPEDEDIRLRLGELLADTDPRRAVGHLRAALAAADGPRGRARVAVRFVVGSLAARRSTDAVMVLEPILTELVEHIGPSPGPEDYELLQCVRSSFLIACFVSPGMIGRATTFLETVAEPRVEIDADRQLLAMMAVADAFNGETPALAADRAERATLVDEHDLGGWAALVSAWVLGLTGDHERAMSTLDAMVERSATAGRLWIQCLSLGTRATIAVSSGAFSSAAADATAALAIALRQSWHFDLVMPTVCLAVAVTHRGQAARADRMLAELSGDGIPSETVLEKHIYLMACACTRAHLGDTEGALTHLRACGHSLAEAGVRNPIFAPWWAEAALLLADLGRPAEAIPLVEHGAELSTMWNVPHARGLVLLARAAVTEPRRRVELLDEAISLLDGPGSRYDQQRAHRALGEALAHLGDQRTARRHLRAAVSVAQQCGSITAVHTNQELLRGAGGRTAPDVNHLDLTAQERQIAWRAAAGHTNREIAAALYFSTRTVESQLSRIYHKLGITGRAELDDAMPPGTPQES